MDILQDRVMDKTNGSHTRYMAVLFYYRNLLRIIRFTYNYQGEEDVSPVH